MATGNLENIKLSQLRALAAVATYGNFSEAALQLSISQSAVSHAIAGLEDELGVVLLSRGRHGARLTPVGEMITTHARDMLRLLDVIGKEANLAKGLEGGHLRIATFRSVGTHVLPEIIARFQRCFPAITVSISEYRGDEGVENSLREGRADLGFTCLPTANEFETFEFMRDEYFVLLPPNLKRPDVPMTWEELMGYSLILPPVTDYCNIYIRQHLAHHNCTLKATYEIQEDSTIVGMVRRGLGVTIMASLAAEPLPPEIQVCRLPVPLERSIRIAVCANGLHPPAVYAFVDMVKEMFPSNRYLMSGALDCATKTTGKRTKTVVPSSSEEAIASSP
ncbi:MAG TPA: LysR family transcriptional regulator [Chroococcidiopsis sp.]